MAVGKDKLMAYYLEHHFSRREVLCRLPLNMSIQTFWPELLSRRKASAVILPLYNATGMPYWYVQTARMVSASERLCEEAMAQTALYDPYRAKMTSAMTEEMYFTSFVEGAQIPLQEAMDFLSRGTEPENIQEQMIWNNRCAWEGMMSGLYRSMDESFIRWLAWTLTAEMDNAAQDYRQTDEHVIAAMNGEACTVPPAFVLPERMNDLCAFLADGDVHPLIKASVAQAYILVTRPFPEGNERLARMLSAAILLRSGYEFFQDVSISGVIARESYRYYKSMCEILRSENGGDLTYFVEYYLELLVRALDAKKERERRREMEALERERELARTPLRTFPRGENGADDDEEKRVTENVTAAQPAGGDEQGENTPVGQDNAGASAAKDEKLPESTQHRFRSSQEFADYVWEKKYVLNGSRRNLVAKTYAMIGRHIHRFTAEKWSRVTGVELDDAQKDCREMVVRGFLLRAGEEEPAVYAFPILHREKRNTRTPEQAFGKRVERFMTCCPERGEKVVSVLGNLLLEGIDRFTGVQWMHYLGESENTARACLRAMISSKLIQSTNPKAATQTYVLCLDPLSAQEEGADQHAREKSNGLADSPKEMGSPEQEKGDTASSLTEEQWVAPSAEDYDLTTLERMAASEVPRDRRIGSTLLQFLEKGMISFTSIQWREETGVGKTVGCRDLCHAVNRGILSKSTGGKRIYSICKTAQGAVRSKDLTPNQKNILTLMYGAFGGLDFSVEECAKAVDTKSSSMQFHLSNFVERGILESMRKQGSGAFRYTFAVTSEDHPECFTQIEGPLLVSEDQKEMAESILEREHEELTA